MTIKQSVTFTTNEQNEMYDIAMMLQEVADKMSGSSSLELADRYVEYDELRDIANILMELSRNENTTVNFD